MINVSIITKQIKAWLETDQELVDHIVTRSEFVNGNPDLGVNGWIGIYRKGIDYDPRNLGVAPNNYEGTVEIMVLVQRTSLRSGAECEDALETSLKIVLDRIVQMPKTYIEHFSDINVDYTYLESEKKTLYFQGALITFTAEVSFEVK